VELLQREEMQLNGAGAERKNASEWSSSRDKKSNSMTEWQRVSWLKS
jgi:hypothetical protein